MKTSKIALLVYLMCCFLAIIAKVFNLSGLILFTMPLILPALFFYYFIEAKKLSILICLFFLSNFSGDFFGLMNFEDEIYYILFPFFISNILMIIIMIKNIEKFKFNLINIISLVIIGSFLLYILGTLLELFSFGENNVQIKLAIFGSSLIVLALLASYNIIWRINTSNLFLMISTSCILISDIFYIIFNFQNQLIVLNLIHFSCQISAYFFFIKYVLLREKEIIVFT